MVEKLESQKEKKFLKWAVRIVKKGRKERMKELKMTDS